VHTEANRGTFVVDYTNAEVDEIFQLRAVLEAHATALAALNGSTEHWDALAEAAADIDRQLARPADDEAQRYLQFQQSNMRFHELILQASGSRRLQAITRSLIELPLVTIKQHAWPGEVRIRRTNEQHWDLIEALRARDPLLGRLRAQAHILSARPRAMLHLALSAADLASPAVDFVVALRMLPVQIALPVLAHHDGWRGVCGLEREQQI
jgi:DNA-binding GntR family transcriptional regulator